MQYKKIENVIDELLASDGLNFYERKLFRKIKRKFCVDNEDARSACWRIQQSESRLQRLYREKNDLLKISSDVRVENVILRKLMNIYRCSTAIFIVAFFVVMGFLVR